MAGWVVSVRVPCGLPRVWKCTAVRWPGAMAYVALPSVRWSRVAVRVPAQPALPLEQVSVGLMEPSGAGAIVPVGRVRAAGGAVVGLAAGVATAMPVGVLELLGSKQTSNSKTGLSTSLPWVSVTVKEPTTLEGPPAV